MMDNPIYAPVSLEEYRRLSRESFMRARERYREVTGKDLCSVVGEIVRRAALDIEPKMEAERLPTATEHISRIERGLRWLEFCGGGSDARRT